MQVVVNHTLVRSKVRLAWLFHPSALVVYAAGLWLSTVQPEGSLESTVLLFGAMAAGLLLYSLGQVPLRRWGPRFRQDAALARALKGLDGRYTLLAFPAASLPDYILVGPGGVRVLVPRAHDGVISCRGDRWERQSGGGLARALSFFARNPLGDPGRDVADGVRRVRARLAARGVGDDRESTVDGLVVFTNPAVKLKIEGCSPTVTGPKQLGNYIRTSKGPFNQQAAAQLVQALQA